MEVLYIYNPQIEAMNNHDEEVQQLFDKITVEIPGVTTGRAITQEAFKTAINFMMDKAYKHGEMQAFEDAENIVDQVFRRTK